MGEGSALVEVPTPHPFFVVAPAAAALSRKGRGHRNYRRCTQIVSTYGRSTIRHQFSQARLTLAGDVVFTTSATSPLVRKRTFLLIASACICSLAFSSRYTAV